MGIKKYRPVTPGQRHKTSLTFEEITKTTPEKSLLVKHNKSGGRNNLGRITSRFRGGGHKRKYRIIDFRRNKYDIEGKVHSIEYDPNRTANIALIFYVDGEKRYIIAPDNLKVGTTIISSEKAEARVGNFLPIKNIPLGLQLHNIELIPLKGAKIARSAGTYATLMAKDDRYAHLKLPSGEVRMINVKCWATIGEVGNSDHEKVSLGKAGRKRWLGRRPHNRGVVMNPVDHPMGGGEGRSSGGRHPCSPWGLLSKGKKTRKQKKKSSKFIVSKRKK